MFEAIAIKYWAPIQACMIALFTWVVWSLRKEFPTHKDVQTAINQHKEETQRRDDDLGVIIDELKEQFQHHHDSLVAVQQTIRHMPTHQDLASIHRRMDDMNAQLQTISGRAEESTKTLRLIHEYLMKGERK